MNGPEPISAREKALVRQLCMLVDYWEESGKKARVRCAQDVRRALEDYSEGGTI